MADFETHPVGTAAELAQLRADADALAEVLQMFSDCAASDRRFNYPLGSLHKMKAALAAYHQHKEAGHE